MTTKELKLKFVRKWCSLLNEADVVKDLDEYAQACADEQSREAWKEGSRQGFLKGMKEDVLFTGKPITPMTFDEWKSNQEGE